MKEITITSKNFEAEVLNSDKPVLLDFWATWCGPCRMIAPFIAEIAEEMGDKIKVGKVNVDEEQELAVKFGILLLTVWRRFARIYVQGLYEVLEKGLLLSLSSPSTEQIAKTYHVYRTLANEPDDIL